MKRRHALMTGLLAGPLAGGAVHAQNDPSALVQQVTQAERAFARSMAERQFDAFVALLSEHAVFFGGQGAHRGKAAVAAAWRPFFDGPKAPFSWEPDQVEVLADGLLAHSSGPVRNPEGQVFSRFNSVWRQEAPGVWRVVFDKGQPLSAADRERYGVKLAP